MASTNIQTFSGVVEIASNLTVDANTFHVDSVAGRVGIGKTDPAFAFDVSGTINATSIYVGGSQLQTGPWTSNASNIYYTTGAIGIGTDSPAKTLEVQGTLRLSDATTGGTSDLLVSRPGIWDVGTKILASDAASGMYYAYSGCDMSNNAAYAIVGGMGANSKGAAYIYTRSGSSWDEGIKIVASDGVVNDNFGHSTAMSGDGMYVIVGAPYVDNIGAAYIFNRTGSNTWDLGKTIVASSRSASDYFGWRVDISDDGTYAIVGAWWDDVVGADTGSASIFRRTGTNTWDTGYTITAGDPATNSYFGRSVAISGDGNYAVVGAWGLNSSQGAVYIFNRTGTNTWSQVNKIVKPGALQYTSQQFGQSVDISYDGTYFIAGADQNRINVQTQGSAYIFKRTGTSWDTGTVIIASDASSARFGYQVKISSDGGYVLATAYTDDTFATDAGSAYIFKRTGTNTWDTGVKLVASDAAARDYFGSSAGISGDGTYAIVGAYGNQDAGSSTGSAYIFKWGTAYSLTSSGPIAAAGPVLSFTGQHMCFPDGPMSQGQIVSANKNKYVSLNGPLTTGAQAIKSSESIPVVCLSNVVNDMSVFGVVDRHEHGGTMRVQQNGIGNVTQEKEWGDNRVIVNSIGEGAMWVTNTNGNLTSGDYITTSNVAGYGQKQDDDTLYSYTVAKITMDCDFEPEDLPIQVIKKDAEGNNILDTYGRIQWEDTDRTEKAYRIRYLTTEGQRTDQANAVWTAAYVGCTYHCG